MLEPHLSQPTRPLSGPPVSLGIQAWTASCAAGWGREALAQALRTNHSGLLAGPDALCPIPSWTGAITHPALRQALPTAWRDWDCRVMRLAFHALHEDRFMAQLAQARARGNPTVDGLGMLMHQARPAFEAWFGILPEITPELRRIMEASI